MTNRIAQMVAAVEAKFPGVVGVVQPHQDPDLAAVRQFVYLVNVQDEELCSVEDYAFDIAEGLYGDDPHDFLVSAVGPINSRKHFPDAVERARGLIRTRQVVPAMQPLEFGFSLQRFVAAMLKNSLAPSASSLFSGSLAAFGPSLAPMLGTAVARGVLSKYLLDRESLSRY